MKKLLLLAPILVLLSICQAYQSLIGHPIHVLHEQHENNEKNQQK